MPQSRAFLFAAFFFLLFALSLTQDEDAIESPPPPGLDTCDGVYISYAFNGRTKEYPHVKNASAQAYAFKSSVTVLNAMTTGLEAWKLFIGFQHREILVSTDGAVIADGPDFPANVENGTTLMGWPNIDLPSSIETAGDINQIQAKIDIVGTQFGVRGKGIPMPKKIELVNDGFKCPKATNKGYGRQLSSRRKIVTQAMNGNKKIELNQAKFGFETSHPRNCKEGRQIEDLMKIKEDTIVLAIAWRKSPTSDGGK